MRAIRCSSGAAARTHPSSYLAAKLAAARLEIWTDVPGLFSANPRTIPTARLLRALHYDEAQEIASNGAKVLHPRCVLPVRQYKIPLHVYATQAPGLEGTVISADVADSAAQVKAIAIKKGITLVSMDSPGMWHQVGFLADAFQVFKEQGISVDLISTSETNVTVSLDPTANTLDPAALERLSAASGELCRVEILGPCASLSLLGRNIRGILHELGAAFELFQDHKVYLVSQAANDLNFTFVIDESQGERLVQQLHERLIQSIGSDKVLGPTWLQLFAPPTSAAPAALNWWEESSKRQRLLEIAARESAAFVYDLPSIDATAAALRGVKSIARWAYAMKANWHPEILRRVYAAGLLARMRIAGRNRARLRARARPRARARAVHAELRAARRVRIRVPTGRARHPGQPVPAEGMACSVRRPRYFRARRSRAPAAATTTTCAPPASTRSSACRSRRWRSSRASRAPPACGSWDCTRTPAAAFWTSPTGPRRAPCSRSSRSISPTSAWSTWAAASGFPSSSARAASIWARSMRASRSSRGAFPTSSSGWSRGASWSPRRACSSRMVTQLKGKGETRYVGIATGMNSLIRPALYGAHHDIRNLTRLEQPLTDKVTVVGPICETADQLGSDRWLPPSEEGDVLLIANCGAYGYAMASHYNLRPPAAEFVIVMTEVGIIGWRGMVGSVLLERMRAERDFDLIEPVFFSTSQAGAAAPDIGRKTRPVQDAHDLAALARLPMLISTQGGDYTQAVHGRAARGGLARLLDRCGFDAAHDGCRGHRSRSGQPRRHARARWSRGQKDFIGGNCTVSLMLMARRRPVARGTSSTGSRP